MTENIPANSAADAITYERPRAFEAIVYGGLTVGVLDALDAIIFFGLRSGTSPKLIFQYIAAALIGRAAAYEGGAATILMGVLLHFAVAFIITIIYYCASLFLPVLIRRAVPCGMLYGVVAHLVMSFIVVPLTEAPPSPFAIAPFLNGIIGHALLIGLPIALITRWSARVKAEN